MQAVVVLGCKPDTNRLTERAAAAAQAWFSLQSSSAILLCTGYASQAELPAEANLLAAQAVSSGVPRDRIVIEDQAQNSIENAFNCLPILQSSNIQHIIIVTSDYHMPRCRLLFEAVLQGTAIALCWAEAYSEVSVEERSKLVQQEVRGMQHLLALVSRPDFHRDMLRDRKLTHPDLLQHCADGVQLPLKPQLGGLAANEKLKRWDKAPDGMCVFGVAVEKLHLSTA
ncbi:hypothetical protein WJX79_003366 [Trebouxia sp. C0005]